MLVYLFIAFGLLMRLIPQFQHSEIGTLFSPVLAIALFSGAHLKKKALFIPLGILLVSDFFLGYYDWRLMAAVYACFILATLLGKYLKFFLIGALIAPVLHFAITNFAVWAFMGWYPMTWAGLYQCFVMAIPFFKNSLIGTVGYSVIFFGAYELAKYLVWKTKKSFSYILHR
jgi:hypothetical protein